MRKLFVLSLLVSLPWVCLSQSFLSNKQIDSLISIMSPEEKAGQMTQIDLGVIAEGGICNLVQPQALNLEKLKTAIVKYHIGRCCYCTGSPSTGGFSNQSIKYFLPPQFSDFNLSSDHF